MREKENIIEAGSIEIELHFMIIIEWNYHIHFTETS